jgi:hypothetical protein
MQVQQKNVMTVNLHLGSASAFALRRRGQDYHLSITAGDDVLHVLLDSHDLQRLRRELASAELAFVPPGPPSELPNPMPPPAAVRPYQWNALDWLSYN